MLSQAEALPGSPVPIVLPLVPRLKSADSGAWGLGLRDVLGLSEVEGELELDGDNEVLGDFEALPPADTYSTSSHKVDTCVEATSGVLTC